MARCRGSILSTVLTTIAAVGALSVAGYTTFSGKSLCSVVGCDSAKSSTTVAASNETKSGGCCPLSAKTQSVAHEAGACDSKAKASCASVCSKPCGSSAGFTTVDASFPMAIPAAFNDGKSSCSSTLVKASNTACSTKVSAASGSCSSKSKAQTIAASSSTCSKTCDKASATVAASNRTCSKPCDTSSETIAASNAACSKTCDKGAKTVAAANSTCAKSCDKPCDKAGAQVIAASNGSCDPAACAAKGCDPAACATKCASKCSKAGFTTVDASFPMAIPAAFNDGKSCCSSTLVKASSETCAKVSAASGCCSSKSKCNGAASQTIAASATTASDSGCCKGTGARADGKACCGKCGAATADTTSETEKSAG